MELIPGKEFAQPGDLAQLAGLGHKNFIVRLTPGKQLQTHRGILQHDDLIGQPWGTRVFSHIGKPFFLLQPSLGDFLLEIKRNTQIMYPKDIGYLMVRMGIGPGKHVLEAGTGSGALTTALAFAVGSHGKVFTYEIRPEMQSLAKQNLRALDLDEQVIFKLRDIVMGFDETGIDALFLDVPNPEDYLAQVSDAIKPGGFFGCILPTVNQLSRLLNGLSRFDFAYPEVCEILLRYYKIVPNRLRPTDRMIAHTGYLVFARAILPIEDGDQKVAGFEESDDR